MDSVTSLYSFSHDDRPDPQRSESPTTPRAKGTDGYFEVNPLLASPSKSQEEAVTPKRSFVVISRLHHSPTSPQFAVGQAKGRFLSRSVPGRSIPLPEAKSCDAPFVAHLSTMQPNTDWTSVHGEQGSEWGEDEAQFEWLDAEHAPEAINGAGNRRNGTSPGKRLTRLKAAVKPTLGVGGGEGRKLRKPLVFPRRAPPPPPAQAEDHHPRPQIITQSAMPVSASTVPQPQFMRNGAGIPSSRSGHQLAPLPQRPILSPHWSEGSPPRSPTPTRSSRTSPQMVPLKCDDQSSLKPRNLSRNSQMSFQSIAYSFYDIKGEATLPSTPSTNETVFQGKYLKVSASSLDDQSDMQESDSSDSTPRSCVEDCLANRRTRSPEDLLHAGIEARGKGDLAKAAWHFMKAAEEGSATGRMYWGESDIAGSSHAKMRYPQVWHFAMGENFNQVWTWN